MIGSGTGSCAAEVFIAGKILPFRGEIDEVICSRTTSRLLASQLTTSECLREFVDKDWATAEDSFPRSSFSGPGRYPWNMAGDDLPSKEADLVVDECRPREIQSR